MGLGVAAFAQECIRLQPLGKLQCLQDLSVGRLQGSAVGDQILDQDIKRAVDAQLAGKGLRRVRVAAIHTSVIRHLSHRKAVYSRWWGGPWANWGNTRVTSSTIEVGKLVIGMFDPASKQLVWRGSAAKTLDIKKDPDKNYRNLEKAIAKLFRNYPQGAGKR